MNGKKNYVAINMHDESVHLFYSQSFMFAEHNDSKPLYPTKKAMAQLIINKRQLKENYVTVKTQLLIYRNKIFSFCTENKSPIGHTSPKY